MNKAVLLFGLSATLECEQNLGRIKNHESTVHVNVWKSWKVEVLYLHQVQYEDFESVEWRWRWSYTDMKSQRKRGRRGQNRSINNYKKLLTGGRLGQRVAR